jgi:hypothetical protein
MIQVWILRYDMDPITAARTGANRTICFDCKLRPRLNAGKLESPCYVELFRAPLGVYDGLTRGIYPTLSPADIPDVFAGEDTRFGAYGDPYALPRPKLEAVARASRRRTGYTHQWRRPDAQWMKEYLMASVDTPAEQQQAAAAGWKTFRVSDGLTPLPDEILCPASEAAGYKTQCKWCGICRGASAPRNVFIPAHGSGRKHALVQINRAAAAAERNLNAH